MAKAKPIPVVLESIEGEDGTEITIYCEPIWEIEALQISESIPGLNPKLGIAKDSDYLDPKLVSASREMIQQFIERATYMIVGGEVVRPAIKFSGEIGLSIDGRFVSDGDKLRLVNAIRSWMTEAAHKAGSRDQQRAGDGGGSGDLDASAGEGLQADRGDGAGDLGGTEVGQPSDGGGSTGD